MGEFVRLEPHVIDEIVAICQTAIEALEAARETAKNLTDTERAGLAAHVGAVPGDCIFFAAGATKPMRALLGAARGEIARKLDIREGTVKVHVTSIMRKFNVRSRLELVVEAFNSGIVSPEGAH